jgi:hypothetical protein
MGGEETGSRERVDWCGLRETHNLFAEGLATAKALIVGSVRITSPSQEVLERESVDSYPAANPRLKPCVLIHDLPDSGLCELQKAGDFKYGPVPGIAPMSREALLAVIPKIVKHVCHGSPRQTE